MNITDKQLITIKNFKSKYHLLSDDVWASGSSRLLSPAERKSFSAQSKKQLWQEESR